MQLDRQMELRTPQPPRFAIFENLENLEKFKNNILMFLDVLANYSHVPLAQSHAPDFLLFTVQLFSSKAVRRGPEANTDVRKKVLNKYFGERYVCQLCVAPKSRKHTPLLCISDTNYRWELNI